MSKKEKFSQVNVDNRLNLHHEIENLLAGASSDYGLAGMQYVEAEVKRLVRSFENEKKTGKII